MFAGASLSLSLVVVAGCVGSASEMGGPDAGRTSVDSGRSEVADAGTTGGLDSGATPADAGAVDAGAAPGDAGSNRSDAGGQDAGPTPVMDFATRCAQPGVVKCVGFDEPADFNKGAGDGNGAWGQNSGLLPVGGTSTYLGAQDTAFKASGNSSLKFTIPSNSAADTSGSYFTNFSSDLTVQFDGNQEFYVQWRQRFSAEYISTRYDGAGGWKQAIIGTGDQVGKPFSSCSSLELVTTDYHQEGFPIMYNSCTGSRSHGPYDGFYEPTSGDDFLLQNQRPDPGCRYHQSTTGYFPPAGNCFGYVPEEWMTFQVHVELGPRVNGEFENSFVTLWAAREGQPSQMLIHWGPYNLTAGDAADHERFGKVWLVPYNTGKSAGTAYPVAYTWYDELIISRNRIADPGGSSPTVLDGGTGPGPVDAGRPVDTDAGQPTSGGGSDAGEDTMPTWRKGLAVGHWVQIPNTALADAPMAVKTYPTIGNTGPVSKIVAWTGFAVDTRDSSVYSLANGGHHDYAGNEVNRLTLSSDVPAWAEPRASTSAAQATDSAEYYADGRPTSRHSYYGVAVNEVRNRAMTVGGARYGNGYMILTADGFNLGTNDWDAANTYPNAPASFSPPGCPLVEHKSTGDLYAVCSYKVERWSNATNAWSTVVASSPAAAQAAASAFDTKRNRVLVAGGYSDDHAVYDLAQNAVTTVTFTGPNAADVLTDANGMVYDANLDAYLIRTGDGGGTLYRINAATYAVDTLPTTGGDSIPATSNGVWKRFLWVPKLKGVVYFPTYEGNAWFLRTW